MTRRASVLCLVIVSSVVFTSCANPYRKFYHHRQISREASTSIIPSTTEPEVYSGRDLDKDWVAMTENGFALLGYSNFNGPVQSFEKAKEQGRDVKAAVVLVYSKYSHTVTGAIPYTIQNPSQKVVTNSSGNVYGTDGGTASYSGTSTATVPGGYTTHSIPYSIRRFDQFASYWVRIKPPRLGMAFRELRSDEHAVIGRNHGLYVTAVMKGSPAFKADFFRGDIIIAIGDREIVDPASFYKAVEEYTGQEVTIVFIRNSKEQSAKVRLQSAE
jgi:hypothetical protein